MRFANFLSEIKHVKHISNFHPLEVVSGGGC